VNIGPEIGVCDVLDFPQPLQATATEIPSYTSRSFYPQFIPMGYSYHVTYEVDKTSLNKLRSNK
jgi:hypothetical protein